MLRLTATQNIAQCGHDESETSKNKGNFLEILNVVGNHDPLVKKRLEEEPRNAEYICKDIQNKKINYALLFILQGKECMAIFYMHSNE